MSIQNELIQKRPYNNAVTFYSVVGGMLMIASVVTLILAAQIGNHYFSAALFATTGTICGLSGIFVVIKALLLRSGSLASPLNSISLNSKIKQVALSIFCLALAGGLLFLSSKITDCTSCNSQCALLFGVLAGLYGTIGTILALNLFRKINQLNN